MFVILIPKSVFKMLFHLGSISSRCSENEPALLPGHKRAAEIEPIFHCELILLQLIDNYATNKT